MLRAVEYFPLSLPLPPEVDGGYVFITLFVSLSEQDGAKCYGRIRKKYGVQVRYVTRTN